MASLGDLNDDLPIQSLSITKSSVSTPAAEINRILNALSRTEGIARGDLEGNFGEAIDTLGQTEQKLLGLTEAARSVNTGALNTLATTLGFGDAQNETDLLQLLRSTPGFQFQFEQGQKAVERSGAARGLLESGAIAQDLTTFGQGLADQRFGGFQDKLLSTINATNPQVQQAIQGTQSLGQNQAQAQLGLGSSLADLGQGISGQRTSSLTNLATRNTNASSLEFDTSRGLSPDDINVTLQNLKGLI